MSYDGGACFFIQTLIDYVQHKLKRMQRIEGLYDPTMSDTSKFIDGTWVQYLRVQHKLTQQDI